MAVPADVKAEEEALALKAIAGAMASYHRLHRSDQQAGRLALAG